MEKGSHIQELILVKKSVINEREEIKSTIRKVSPKYKTSLRIYELLTKNKKVDTKPDITDKIAIHHLAKIKSNTAAWTITRAKRELNQLEIRKDIEKNYYILDHDCSQKEFISIFKKYKQEIESLYTSHHDKYEKMNKHLEQLKEEQDRQVANLREIQ